MPPKSYRPRRKLPAIPVGMVASRAARDIVMAGARAAARRVTTRGGVAALAGGAAATTGAMGYAAHQRNKTRGVKRLRSGAPVAGTSFRANKGTAEIQWNKFHSKTRGQVPFTVKELAKIATYRQILRFQNVGPVDKGVDRGAFFLGPMVTTTDTLTAVYNTQNNALYTDNNSTTADLSLNTGYLRCPYHLYLLNQTNLHETPEVGPAYQPFIKQDTGTVTFANLYGTNRAAAADIAWEQEWVSQGSPLMQKYIKQAWYQIKLGLRNALTQTTYFDIWVFSFRDGYMDPLEIPSTADEIKNRHAFYHGLAAQGIRHPLVDDQGFTKAAKSVKFLKKIRIVMDRQQTNDQDTSPDIKVVNWFIRDGKMYDYQYAGSSSVANATNAALKLQDNNAWTPQGPGVIGNQTASMPKARSRIWLMVRAFDPSVAASANGDATGFTINNTPSYDIILRKCELARAN